MSGRLAKIAFGASLAVVAGVIPSLASAEWRVLGPMMASPDWLDTPAVEQANQAELAAEAEMRRLEAISAWQVAEAERRASLPRRASTQSVDGAAELGFGCSESGTLYVSLVLTGYETESGIVRVTHWVDAELPRRVPWFSVSADLEVRVFTDRAVFVEQFLKSASGGESISIQIETFPTTEFVSPDRDHVVAPILENCQLLSAEIETPADFEPAVEEMVADQPLEPVEN